MSSSLLDWVHYVPNQCDQHMANTLSSQQSTSIISWAINNFENDVADHTLKWVHENETINSDWLGQYCIAISHHLERDLWNKELHTTPTMNYRPLAHHIKCILCKSKYYHRFIRATTTSSLTCTVTIVLNILLLTTLLLQWYREANI